MEIIQHEQQKHNILLTSDYCPNQAMINEFQTIFFYMQAAADRAV